MCKLYCLTKAFGSLFYLLDVSCTTPKCNSFISIERYASTLSSPLLTADLWTLPVGKWALHDITHRSQLLRSFTAHYYMGDNACYIIQTNRELCAMTERICKMCSSVYIRNTLRITLPHYEKNSLNMNHPWFTEGIGRIRLKSVLIYKHIWIIMLFDHHFMNYCCHDQ